MKRILYLSLVLMMAICPQKTAMTMWAVMRCPTSSAEAMPNESLISM